MRYKPQRRKGAKKFKRFAQHDRQGLASLRSPNNKHFSLNEGGGEKQSPLCLL